MTNTEIILLDTLKEIGLVAAVTCAVLAVAFASRMLYLQLFFKVDDDVIVPKDHLIDDLYETNIGGKK